MSYLQWSQERSDPMSKGLDNFSSLFAKNDKSVFLKWFGYIS